MKKLTLAVVLILALVLSSLPAFAEERGGFGRLIPASILADRLDVDIEDITEQRQSGIAFCQIAEDNGLSAEDYKKELLEKKNAYIDEQIKSGRLTEEQGKLIKERIKNNIENCNQTPGADRMNGGCGMGGFGRGSFGRGGRTSGTFR